ncbi:SRPBCC domain-containing protein [Candidatus Curtissbacteria bacterium]|nr:SRPBCC domain-containing protein [Candidatus Curtissbacteria bacterium]
MKTINQTYTIKAPIEKVWKALVDPQEIDDWGGGPAEMDGQAGTEFKLWGGDIWGKNLEVVPNEKLVQEWYGGDWPEPSKATFTLKSADGATTVELVNENVPDREEKEIAIGWKKYYLGPMKEMLEM